MSSGNFFVAGLPEPPGLLQRPAQNELYLAVHTAQFVGGPAFQLVVDLGFDAQEEGLLLGHDPNLCVERTRIDYGLRRAIAAQDHQEIADHCGLSLLVEVHDVALG